MINKSYVHKTYKEDSYGFFMGRIRNVIYGGLATILLSLSGCSKIDEEIKKTYDTTSAEIKPVDTNKRTVALIVDTSSSMEETINNEKKINSVKKAYPEVLLTYKTVDDTRKNIEMGLFYFSADRGVTNLVPIGKFDYKTLEEKITKLETNPFSGTPLGMALAYAERELDKKASGIKNILLLTDGENSVGREPEEIWKNIIETNAKTGDSPTNLYIIGFDVNKERFKELEKLGAVVYEAKDAENLYKVLRENTKIILEAVN